MSAVRASSRRFGALALLVMTAATAAAPSVATDPHSYAEPRRLRVQALAIDLEVDFAARRLRGHVDLEVERLDPAATELTLDTRDLDIARVQLLEPAAAAAPLAHALDAADPFLGQALRIQLPAILGAAREVKVRVEYATRPTASALQWLEPAQTSGPHPYVYSQSQAIHARSWLPVPDSPGIRMRYTARLRVPPELVAVMSAAGEAAPGSPPGEFRFAMPQPVPAYLIAFAVGDLRFQSLDARTGVWAEPSVLAAAAREFADLPAMLAATEQKYGPYRWDRYDVLVMPRSFPYGGMENPRLSFVSPSLVAGDRSLVSTVVHELAHSWSGNLVTNATWDHFWLNEGFTTYLERRVLAALYGDRRAQMEDAIGAAFMRQAIADAKADGRARDTALVLDLAGRDPDEGSSDIAYEKGRWFLGWLEARYGRATLDALLREWFAAHAFGSVTTPEFVGHLQRFLRARRLAPPPAAELGEWLYGEGLPASAPLPPNEAFAEVDRVRTDWLAERLAIDALPAGRWSTQEWQRFLDELPADLDDARIGELRERFGLGPHGNAEIARSWCALVIRTAYAPAFGDVEHFLDGTGRYRLVVTLFRDLARTPTGLELGRRIYAQARAGYHASIRAAVERELRLGETGS